MRLYPHHVLYDICYIRMDFWICVYFIIHSTLRTTPHKYYYIGISAI